MAFNQREIALRRRRAVLTNKCDDLLARAERENRDLNADEESEFEVVKLDIADIDKRIDDSINDVERERRSRHGGHGYLAGGSDAEWRNFGEFMYTIAHNPGDSRLHELRVQQMKDGTAGGYAVPAQFASQMLQVPSAPAIIRPRATVLPAGSPPDAEITIPALDQRAASNMYGGVTIYHMGESDTATESTAALLKITLKPKKLIGYMTASNELMNNWDAASIVIPQLMRSAMDAQEDTDFLSGDGVNKAQGVLNAAAAIDVARGTANQIAWADIYTMLSRLRSVGGQPVWVASQTTIPQLVQIADASSRAIWAGNAAAGVPPTLYGYPVLFHDRSPALGTKGDLMLADFRAYIAKDGSGPTIAVSGDYRFQTDETAFRITWHVDGQSWLSEPLVLEGSTSNTVSPFVVLDTP